MSENHDQGPSERPLLTRERRGTGVGPITTLDPKTALVIIDLQEGIVGLPTAHPVGAVVAHAARLAKPGRPGGPRSFRSSSNSRLT